MVSETSRLLPGDDRLPSVDVNQVVGLVIMGFCVLVGDMSRGIYFPTLYLNVLRCGGDNVTAGVAVASMSAGRIVISPYFGRLSETIRHRHVLCISTGILFVGAYMYSQASSVQGIIAGQFVVGIGSGTLGVTRSYVAETTHRDSRTENMAYLTAMQYTGFAVFPIVGAVLTSIGNARNGEFLLGLPFLPITQFTLPAYFTMACCAVINACLVWLFQDYVITDDMVRARVSAESKKRNEELAQLAEERAAGPAGVEACTDPEACKDPPTTAYNCAAEPFVRLFRRMTNMPLADKLAIGGCILNITTKGTIGVYETLGVSIARSQLGWDNVRAGYLFSAGGAVGVGALLSFAWLVRTFGDIKLVVWGLGIMIVSLLLMVDWTGNGISPVAFLLAVPLMYSIGYPVGHTAELGMFSKITSKGPQGAIQGWFGSAGSLGRIFYPIMAGVLTQYINASAIFVVAAAGLALSIASVLVYRQEISSIIGS